MIRDRNKVVPWLLVVIVAALSGGGFGAESLPAGWRRATPQEASGQWRKKSSTRFLIVEADLNNDGRPDRAELLLDRSGKHFGLFVRLSSSSNGWKLLSRGDAVRFTDYGINAVAPGKYETACGKGYGDYACSHGEPDVLELTTWGVDFFVNESADSVFYWDHKTRTFREVLMSD